MVLLAMWGCGATARGDFEVELTNGGEVWSTASGSVAIDDRGCFMEAGGLDVPGLAFAEALLDEAVCGTSQGVTRGDGGTLWLSYRADRPEDGGGWPVEVAFTASIDGGVLTLEPLDQ